MATCMLNARFWLPDGEELPLPRHREAGELLRTDHKGCLGTSGGEGHSHISAMRPAARAQEMRLDHWSGQGW